MKHLRPTLGPIAWTLHAMDVVASSLLRAKVKTEESIIYSLRIKLLSILLTLREERSFLLIATF